MCAERHIVNKYICIAHCYHVLAVVLYYAYNSKRRNYCAFDRSFLVANVLDARAFSLYCMPSFRIEFKLQLQFVLFYCCIFINETVESIKYFTLLNFVLSNKLMMVLLSQLALWSLLHLKLHHQIEWERVSNWNNLISVSMWKMAHEYSTPLTCYRRSSEMLTQSEHCCGAEMNK